MADGGAQLAWTTTPSCVRALEERGNWERLTATLTEVKARPGLICARQIVRWCLAATVGEDISIWLAPGFGVRILWCRGPA